MTRLKYTVLHTSIIHYCRVTWFVSERCRFWRADSHACVIYFHAGTQDLTLARNDVDSTHSWHINLQIAYGLVFMSWSIIFTYAHEAGAVVVVTSHPLQFAPSAAVSTSAIDIYWHKLSMHQAHVLSTHLLYRSVFAAVRRTAKAHGPRMHSTRTQLLPGFAQTDRETHRKVWRLQGQKHIRSFRFVRHWFCQQLNQC